MSDEDRVLLDAWRAGDVGAGERLFDRHFASVRRFFCNKAPPTEIEDLVQGTFEACLAYAHQYRGDARFVAYLLAIARSQLHRWLRRRDPVREGIHFSTTSLADLGVSPSGLVADLERENRVLDALRRLPLELQTVLELHYWEGMAGPDIAEVVGIPHGTVRSRLHRARERLREELLRLERHGGWTDLEAIDTETRAIAALLM